MNLTIVRTLTKGEQSLIMDTRPKQLDGLSEDALLDLHTRVRRGRTKYSKLYRQAGSKQVRSDRARGAASKKSRKDAERAEVFEDALARVSDRLSKAARKSANDLRKTRIAAAKAAKGKPAAKKAAAKKASSKKPAAKKSSGKGSAAKRKSTKTPVSKRSVASQRATKARKGAKRGR